MEQERINFWNMVEQDLEEMPPDKLYIIMIHGKQFTVRHSTLADIKEFTSTLDK